MPKQDKEKAKMGDFVFLEVARFARSEQAGNPRFQYADNGITVILVSYSIPCPFF